MPIPLQGEEGTLSKILSEGHKDHLLYVVVNHGTLAANRCKILKQMDQTHESLWLCFAKMGSFFLISCPIAFLF